MGKDLDPYPTIPITAEEFEEWREPWKNTLIVNVLGKRMSYKMMENKLQRHWLKTGSIRIVDLPQDYFLVPFIVVEDYRHATFEGPWMLADHYLL